MFAQKFHPAMRFAGPVRREIGIRTVFNVLGPLTNPARAEYQVVGVAAAPLADKLANALSRMGTQHALVVHGSDGMDEISISAPSMVWEVRAGQEPRRYEIEPGDFGLDLAPARRAPGRHRRRERRDDQGAPGGESMGRAAISCCSTPPPASSPPTWPPI